MGMQGEKTVPRKQYAVAFVIVGVVLAILGVIFNFALDASKTFDLPWFVLPPITVTKSPSFSVRFRPFRATFSLMVPGLNVLYIFLSSSIICYLHVLLVWKNILLSSMEQQGRLQQQVRTASSEGLYQYPSR